jgi:hypothetical protein
MKIFLSSAENNWNYEKLMQIKEPKNVLLTFYYLKSKKDSAIKEMLENYKKTGCSIMLDSGAFTFLHEVESSIIGKKFITKTKKHKTKETPEEYFKKYLLFLTKFHQYFSLIVELDIDAIVGYNIILEWRDKILSLGIPKSKIVTVYHPTIPNYLLEWERWCKEGYIYGLGSFSDMNRYNILFKIALQYKTKVHGFAMTKCLFMKKYPLYSVDSSTWNNGQRFGVNYFIKQHSLTIHSINVKKLTLQGKKDFLHYIFPVIKQYCPPNISLDILLINSKYSFCFDLNNINLFLKLEKLLTNLWKARGIDFDN